MPHQLPGIEIICTGIPGVKPIESIECPAVVLIHSVANLQGLRNLFASDLLPSLDTLTETERVGKKSGWEPQFSMYRELKLQEVADNQTTLQTRLHEVFAFEQDMLKPGVADPTGAHIQPDQPIQLAQELARPTSKAEMVKKDPSLVVLSLVQRTSERMYINFPTPL